MTDVLIKRELLELSLNGDEQQQAKARNKLREQLAAPRQPEGGLEVVGYRCWFKKEPENIMVEWGKRAPVGPKFYSEHEDLCRLSDHQRAIAELREECERLQYAADHNSECVRLLQDERDTLRQQRDKLAGLLREKFPRIDPENPYPLDEVEHHCEYTLYQERERLHREIDAALAEVGQ